MVKVCTKCKVEKHFDEFHKNKRAKDGLQCSCKSCKKECAKEYYQKNKEHIKECVKEYSNKEHVKKRIKEYKKEWRDINKEYNKEYSKEWYQKNKEHHKEHTKKYQKQRKKTDALFKMKGNLRSRTSKAFKNKGYSKNTKTQEMLGVDWEIAKQHIERQFIKGMSWDNYGEWHIDHIIPLSSAKTSERLKKLCHYTNLQPMWAVDNLIKSDSIIGQQTLLRI